MGISIDVTTDTWGVDNLDWLASRKGFDTCRSITLDLDLFTDSGDGIVDSKGLIPSGTLVALVTDTGLYGPYNPDVDPADGTEDAAGHLLHGVRVSDSEGNSFAVSGVAMLWEGIVLRDKLPEFSGDKGQLDAGAEADLSFIRYEGEA